MPQISIIVPVYKVEPYIHRCVDSILAQTFTDFELILVDDGSPDNCPAICDEYASKDKRIHVIHQSNGGLSAARNAGIDWAFANSDSEWLSFIDSDDWIHKEYLQQLYDACVKNNLSISACAFMRTDKTMIEHEEVDSILEIYDPETLWSQRREVTVASTKLYAKNLWKDIRFPLGKLHEDEYITYRLLFLCDNIGYISFALYYYYQTPNSIMHLGWSLKRSENSIEALEGQLDYFGDRYPLAYQRSLLSYIWGLAEAVDKTRKEDYKRECLIYRRKLRRTLSNHYRLFSFNENSFMYYQAFPIMSKCYYYFSLIIRKIKR